MKKILVIAAHPDDEIYGMGGTISRLSQEGKEVHLLIVTDGSTAQYRNFEDIEKILLKKREETQNAARIVGIKKVHYGNLPDMRLDATEHIEVNHVIEKIIDEVKPDTVFTHFWGDVNLDHRCVYNSTIVAARPTPNSFVKELYCYSVPSSTEWQPVLKDYFVPNFLVDISKHSENKLAAIRAYETELRDFPHPRSVEAVEIQDKSVGLKCGLTCAEEFILIRKIEQ